MGVSLGGRGIGDNLDLNNKGLREEAAGKNCGICSRETNIQTLYSHRADGGFQ